MKYLISIKSVKNNGIIKYTFLFFLLLSLICIQKVNGQIAELSDYRWEVFNSVKSTIELPNDIDGINWEPRNDPGFENQGTRENNKKQYSFIINNPKTKYFQLTLNEITPKGIRTHLITLIVSQKEFDPTTSSSNLRFKTDKDIVEAMTLQRKSAAAVTNNQIKETAESTAIPIVNKQEVAEKKTTLLEDKINAADKLFKAQDLKGAEKMYKEALLQDPLNPHIKAQLENISAINARFAKEIESLELKTKTYQQNLNKAEDHAGRAEWVMARYYYKEALKYAANPNAVNKALAKVEQKEKEQKQIESNYNNFKSKALAAGQKGDYATAISNWEEALNVKSGDAYATAELAKSKSNLQDKLAEEARLEKFNAERKLENDFLVQIGKADVALRNNDFETSRQEVVKAASIKPNDPRVGQKMSFIEQTENKYKDSQAALLEKEREKRYNALIADAQKQNAAGKYLEAIKLYEAAQREKMSDPYPSIQIKAIIEKQENLAREAEMQKKKAAIAALKLQVNKHISDGDKALAANNLDAAESSFLESIRLDPENPYPVTKLKEIEEKREILQAKLTADRQKEAEQRIINFKYDSLMAIADTLIANNVFEMGIMVLEEALQIKKNDHIASGKLAKVKKQKEEAILYELQLIQLSKKRELDSLEALGTKAIIAREYYEAKEYFTKASHIFEKPSGYTNSQLKHINLTIADREQKEKEQQDEANFKLMVKTAENALSTGDFLMAEEATQKANKIRADDPKVKALLFKLTDPVERKRLEMDASRVLSNKLVDSAQIQIQEKKFEVAITLLDKAKELWPQNNRITFLKNQAVEGATGVPINQKNQAEVKFSFERNPTFRKSQTTSTPNSNESSKVINQNDTKPIQENLRKEPETAKINMATSKADAEPHKTLGTDVITKEEAKPLPVTPLKKIEIDSIKEHSLNSKVEEVTNNLITQNDAGIFTSPNSNNSFSKTNTSYNNVIKKQQSQIPYEPAALANKFPEIDFSKPPHGQKFTIDFYNEHEKEMNRSKSEEILIATSNLPVRDSLDKVLVQLDNLSFGVYNSYFRITITNYSDKDFAVGYMMLSLERKSGVSSNYEPSFISSFPVVAPNHQSSLIYTTRQILLNNDDKILLNVFERKTNARFTIELPGELYNNEYDK